MLAVRFRIPWVVLVGASIASCWAANFGTVVPINGTVSDIALDERREVVWAANFSAYRVEQLDIATRILLGTPLTVPMPPSAVALSPDHRFLVVGEYQAPDPAELSLNPFAPGTGGYTLFDLDANQRFDVNLNSPVLAVAFGGNGNAVIVTRIPVPADPKNPGPLTNVFQLQPFPFQTLIPITSVPATSKDLPVPLATFPTQIAEAAAGVSGDGNTIVILAAPSSGAAGGYLEVRYDVPSATATYGIGTSSPLEWTAQRSALTRMPLVFWMDGSCCTRTRPEITSMRSFHGPMALFNSAAMPGISSTISFTPKSPQRLPLLRF